MKTSLPVISDQDDRIKCGDCRNVGSFGECRASPYRRDFITDKTILRRCQDFAPKPDSKDKRNGRQRWPYLTNQPNKETKKK